MALDTVADYVALSRDLLVDKIQPYRYDDDKLVNYLNLAILESRRLRPELWLPLSRTNLPQFSALNMGAAVPIDQMYRMAFPYYIAGQAQLLDEEDTSDQRGVAFIQKFGAQLTGGQV